MINVKHPWQAGPTELIEYATTLSESEKEFDKLIAYLLIDLGVETLFKAYLKFEETDFEMDLSEKQKAIKGNFPELVKGTKKASGGNLEEMDFKNVSYYHSLRNTLYHEGGGITISSSNVHAYANLAKKFLKTLMGIRLENKPTNQGFGQGKMDIEAKVSQDVQNGLTDKQLEDAITAAGKKTFVDYYELFEDVSNRREDLIELLMEQEGYKASSCQTKISSSRRIIEAGRASEILQDIVLSKTDKIKDETKEKARQLLKKYHRLYI